MVMKVEKTTSAGRPALNRPVRPRAATGGRRTFQAENFKFPVLLAAGAGLKFCHLCRIRLLCLARRSDMATNRIALNGFSAGTGTARLSSEIKTSVKPAVHSAEPANNLYPTF